MQTSPPIRLLPRGDCGSLVSDTAVRYISCDQLGWPIRRAIQRARQRLLTLQLPDGRFDAPREADAGQYAETILLLRYWGTDSDGLIHRAAARLQQLQRPDGGFSAARPAAQSAARQATGESCTNTSEFSDGLTVEDAQFDPGVTIRAYFALKVAGHEPSSTVMQRARRAILSVGGAAAADSVTRLLLAMFGQLDNHHVSGPRDDCGSSDAALAECPPRCELPPEQGVGELFLTHPDEWPPAVPPEDTEPGDLRRVLWELAAMKNRGQSSVFGAPLAEGTSLRQADAVWQACRNRIDESVREAEGQWCLVTRNSAVRDTAWGLTALVDSSSAPNSSRCPSAADWLMQQIEQSKPEAQAKDKAQQRACTQRSPNNTVSGLSIAELADSASALSALAAEEPVVCDSLPPELRLFAEVGELSGELNGELSCDARSNGNTQSRRRKWISAAERVAGLLIARQGEDGGFDRVEATAKALTALGRLGKQVGETTIDRVVKWMLQAQQSDGCWAAEQGGTIAGTSIGLAGLRAVGLAEDHPAVVAAAHWLLAHQQPDGGWGEPADLACRPHLRGEGESNALHTALAVMGLLESGRGRAQAVDRGVDFLLQTQHDDGTWSPAADLSDADLTVQPQLTDLDSLTWPLLALARWALHQRQAWQPEQAVALRLVEFLDQ